MATKRGSNKTGIRNHYVCGLNADGSVSILTARSAASSAQLLQSTSGSVRQRVHTSSSATGTLFK